MKRKSTAQTLREASPGLTVIPGGSYRHGPKKKGVKLEEQPKPELPHYEPHKATEEEWEAAGGEICPICGNYAVRLLPYGISGTRKACPNCISKRRSLLDYKTRVMPSKSARPARGGATRVKLMLIKYNNKRK